MQMIQAREQNVLWLEQNWLKAECFAKFSESCHQLCCRENLFELFNKLDGLNNIWTVFLD